MNESGFDGDIPTTFLDDVNELSKKNFGEFRRALGVPLIANDEGYIDVREELKGRLAEIDGGMGVFVGGGGLLSLLPELPVDVVLAVDMNPAVLEMNKTLAELIKESETPDEVKAKLLDPEIKERYPILRDVYSGDTRQLLVHIDNEHEVFSNDHWTDPERFIQVKEALVKKPIVYVAADIRNPDLALSLKDVAEKHSKKISFANFTNVHAWISSDTPQSKMDFVRKWPFMDDASILYSSAQYSDEWPQMQLAKGNEEYIRQANLLQR